MIKVWYSISYQFPKKPTKEELNQKAETIVNLFIGQFMKVQFGNPKVKINKNKEENDYAFEVFAGEYSPEQFNSYAPALYKTNEEAIRTLGLTKKPTIGLSFFDPKGNPMLKLTENLIIIEFPIKEMIANKDKPFGDTTIEGFLREQIKGQKDWLKKHNDSVIKKWVEAVEKLLKE